MVDTAQTTDIEIPAFLRRQRNQNEGAPPMPMPLTEEEYSEQLAEKAEEERLQEAEREALAEAEAGLETPPQVTLTMMAELIEETSAKIVALLEQKNAILAEHNDKITLAIEGKKQLLKQLKKMAKGSAR